jgi:transposase|tara:strand:+ start:182 stop:463 length:282 start_codon:yes stop_codon:yes gene_type:complete
MIKAIRAQQRYIDRLEKNRHKLIKTEKGRTAKATIPDTVVMQILLARAEQPKMSKAGLARKLNLSTHMVYNVVNRYELTKSPAAKPWYRSRGL